MQTGNRWDGNANPRDLTKTRQQQLLREHEARKRAQENPVDVEAICAQIRKEIYVEAFEAGAAWAFEQLANAGIDVDAVLALADDERDEGGE
jgi:hypothetical protein